MTEPKSLSRYVPSDDLEFIRVALLGTLGAMDALKELGAHRHLPGFDSVLAKINQAITKIEKTEALVTSEKKDRHPICATDGCELVLQASRPPSAVCARPELVAALRAYEQADMDGVFVKVSRQACDEAAQIIEGLVISATRPKIESGPILDHGAYQVERKP